MIYQGFLNLITRLEKFYNSNHEAREKKPVGYCCVDTKTAVYFESDIKHCMGKIRRFFVIKRGYIKLCLKIFNDRDALFDRKRLKQRQ